MPLATQQNAEPIPGYALKERIGAGGYGEVWAAEAPGGLVKAIKFVYGYLDEHRAARELKALNRVKQLRHPFLLSLERIEVVDGQLVIVTELAESNLKERFDACVTSGLPGIPLEELLIYIGDAADALDFMSEQHSLQHLDVKPENLLLVGGRVKVADFGLVKEVHDVTASLMGGLTPLYAPPEVFDNRPSRQSDQYSLAIVFQEMLTGVLPFPGATAAQLATQHLNSRPRLGSLPEHFQPVVARALEKDPLRRHGSCRDLVHALQDAGRTHSGHPPRAAGATAHAAPKPHAAPSSPGEKHGLRTEAISDLPAAPARRSSSSLRSPTPVVSLPPVDLSTEEPVLHPTVFVGLGGVAGAVLKHLRRRLFARCGEPTRTPALRMLLIDPDARAAMRNSQGDGGGGFLPMETLITPLRRTQAYRDASSKLLRWISRRWLYNIPKSLLTEGMRPLGRLALADHAQQARERLTRALADVTAAQNVQRTAETMGVKATGAPRIVVIAATSGGAGSGMAIDVGYLARQALREASLDGEVVGILAHGAGRLVNARELALANTYSCLAELNHYSQKFAGYPGDAALELPAFEQGVAPFDITYLTHLGEDLNEDGFEAAADRLAAYLYLDAATTGGMFFTAARRSDAAARSGHELAVRSFGVCQIDGSQDDVLAAAVEVLCRNVCQRWRGASENVEPSPAADLPEFHIAHQIRRPGQEIDIKEVEQLGEQLANSLELSLDPLLSRVHAIVDQNLGSESTAYFHQILAPLFPTSGKLLPHEFKPTRVEEALATIDGLLGLGAGDAMHEGAHNSLTAFLTSRIDALAMERSKIAREAMLDWLDRSRSRVAGAVALSEWCASRLQQLETSIRDLSQQLASEQSRIEQLLPGRQAVQPGKTRQKSLFVDEPKLTHEWRERLLHYAKVRLSQVVVRAAARFTQVLRSEVGAVEHAVKMLKRDITHLENEFRISGWNAAVADASNDGVKATIVSAIRCRLADLTVQADRACGQDNPGGVSVLRLAAEKRLDLQAGFADRLRRLARSSLSLVMRDVDLSAALLKAQGSADDSSNRLPAMLAAARPTLLAQGGQQRMLLVLPEGSSEASLRETISAQIGQPPTVVYDSDRDATICYEVNGLILSQAAATIIEHRSEYVQAAQRLHTRTDVEWSPLA